MLELTHAYKHMDEITFTCPLMHTCSPCKGHGLACALTPARALPCTQSMVEGQLSEALTQSANARSSALVSSVGVADDEHAVGEPAAIDDRIRTLCGLLMAVGR